MRMNCWEFKKCGRQHGGHHVHDLGVCPASMEQRLDGVHGGKNAGRSCWVVAETLCQGDVQGTYAKKFQNCNTCDFYQTVKKREYPAFKLSLVLLDRLKQ